jgi:transposase
VSAAGQPPGSREIFVPLAHPPGHAQVDFGEWIGVIGGVRMKLHVFCFDLPPSDACFIKAYPAEATEAFLDGHISALPFSAAYRYRFCTIISKSQWRAF